ncbi:MAG: RluA family pseudouridine synthase [Acidobacteriota bacterium]|nr:RluA family pseudouridine synthase [Acidobacteriota bacterium]
MLSRGQVCVDGEVCVRANHPVRAGSVIEVGSARTVAVKLPYGLEVIYEDDAILVVRKPVNLLTVASAGERERTAYACLRSWLKERNPGQKLFTVHRLDKFASGLLVFAKSETVQARMKTLFSRHDIERRYWAVVEGVVARNQGTIRSYLYEDQMMRMHSTEDARRGKLAVTHYRVLRRLRDVTSLEITLETGRKNQIRAHLSEMGHPIVGDRAYGAPGQRRERAARRGSTPKPAPKPAKDPLKRLGLHAFQLGFAHPVTGKPMLFQTDPPPEFRRYL